MVESARESARGSVPVSRKGGRGEGRAGYASVLAVLTLYECMCVVPVCRCGSCRFLENTTTTTNDDTNRTNRSNSNMKRRKNACCPMFCCGSWAGLRGTRGQSCFFCWSFCVFFHDKERVTTRATNRQCRKPGGCSSTADRQEESIGGITLSYYIMVLVKG